LLTKLGLIKYETLIIVSGTVGRAVNNFRRIQNLTMAHAENSNAISDRLAKIKSFLSAGLLVFLYTIFMAGFVRGSLFPVFASEKEGYKSFSDFASLSIPLPRIQMLSKPLSGLSLPVFQNKRFKAGIASRCYVSLNHANIIREITIKNELKAWGIA
jgi:hypothetical protein